MKRTADNAFRKDCISEEHILEVEELRVSYDHHRSGLLAKEGKTEVLHGVSFFIQRGEVLGLVGESGCGKSTLSRAILGLLPDYEGTIRCAAKMPQMVFQDPYSSLNPAKKVGWILEEPLRLRTKLCAEERRQKVHSMLERVGLEEKIADRFPRQLSLDVTIQAQIIELLIRLQKEMGLAILFISHDMRVVYQLCQRVMVMKDGCIVESGDVDEVYFHPQHPYTKELLEAAGIEDEAEEQRKGD